MFNQISLYNPECEFSAWYTWSVWQNLGHCRCEIKSVFVKHMEETLLCFSDYVKNIWHDLFLFTKP